LLRPGSGKLNDSGNDTKKSQHRSDPGTPNDHACPEWTVAPQRSEVKPVWYGRNPRKSPRAACCLKANFCTGLGYIQLGASQIVNHDLVHRQQPALANGPLVRFGETAGVMQLFCRKIHEAAGNLHCLGPADIFQHVAVVGEDSHWLST